MFGTPSLASLLDEQTLVLRTQLRQVYDGSADAIHDSRVATRRIRELLALVPSIPGRDGEADVASGYKAMGRALGRVRDIDVQIALIKDLEAHAPQTAPSLVLVRQDHEQARLKNMRRLIKTLERLDVEALLHFIGDGHPAGLRRRLTSKGWRQQIHRLVIERSHTALEAMERATGVYFPKRMHRARIALKQLRYAGEIAVRTGFAEMQTAIATLKRGQQVLGDLHDRQALADSLTDHAKHDGLDLEHIELTRQVLEGEVTALHESYLCRRESLRQACVTIDDVASRLPNGALIGVGAAAVAVSGLLYARAFARHKDGRAIAHHSSLIAYR